MHVQRLRLAAVAGLAVAAMTVAACGSSGGSTTSSSPSAGTSAPAATSTAAGSGSGSASAGAGTSGGASGGTTDAAKATSVADFGGMDGLVAAAKKEGTLNVIALPPDWANYGEIIKAFSAKYGITVNSQNPNGSSAQEIQAAQTNKGTDKAPDVFDLGTAVTLASTAQFAPYKVAAWNDIPDGNKDPNGLWYNDYTGVMAVGYNSTKFGDITSLNDLKNAKFKGTVTLDGDPTQAGAAFTAFVMATLANGGSVTNLQPGLDYFMDLKKAGNFIPLKPTAAAIASGQTSVVIDWSYNQLPTEQAMKKQGITWKTYVPANAVVGSYYSQAINKDAPHPAAARLWEEYLYTAAAQNQWMAGGAQPILYDAMKKAGTLDASAQANLPKTSSPVIQITADQAKSISDFLNKNWTKVSG